MNPRRHILLLVAVLLTATSLFAGTGRVVIVNVDNPGTGFNDPSPRDPVGGNTGTTLGAQRLNVFQAAAKRWTDALDTNVDIRVRASFAPLQCTADSGVLGSTFANSWSANFPGAPRQDVWYPAALANKFANSDLTPTQEDMTIQFNVNIGNANCIANSPWYYGLDGNEGDADSLYHVVMHEIAHGLGVSGRGYPDFFGGRPAVFDTHVLDLTAGLRWDQMTPQQRDLSSTNAHKLVWEGANVREKAPKFLQNATTFTISQTPSSKTLEFGTASFGPQVGGSTTSARLVQAVDEANPEGPATNDGCTAFTNASAVAGNIAVVSRGTCTFVQKALNAQAAGAIGLVIVDNRTDCLPPGMGGSNDDVQIPVISVTQVDGTALLGQLASGEVSGTLRPDPSRLAGASDEGYVRLYAPCTLEPGSSIYHFDTTTSPNLLMEPFINSDLADSLDLTTFMLFDIGWTAPPRTGRRILKR